MSYNIKNIRKNITLIESEITQLKSQDITNSFDIEMHILEKFPDFYSSYPFLVKKICKQDNYDIIFSILNQLETVENGENSFTDVEHKLSVDLANKFLYPNINK